MTSAAIISACGAYRYTLHRHIPGTQSSGKPCLFIMLNPSTADATQDDPTIRRCIGFAKREGCSGLTVVNLFGLRATDPTELTKHPDPFGPDNAYHIVNQIQRHQRRGIIVAAWGANRFAQTYESIDVLKMALVNNWALCLGVTGGGHPRHPLYVKNDQPLIPWVPPSLANTVITCERTDISPSPGQNDQAHAQDDGQKGGG